MVHEQATPSASESIRGTRSRCGDERGQSLVEFAMVIPMLMLLILGIFKCGILFNNWVVLTDAVRIGTRQLSISRAPSQDACQMALTQLRASAYTLKQQNLNVSWSVTSSCTNLLPGSQATVTATYPCDLELMGFDFAPSCTLRAQQTGRIE